MELRHLGPKLHRFVYSFFRKSDQHETIELYTRAQHLLAANNVGTSEQIDDLIQKIAFEAIDTLAIPEKRHGEVHGFVRAIIEYERLFDLPDIDFSEPRTVAQLWELNEDLQALKGQLEKTPEIIDALTNFVVSCFSFLKNELPDRPETDQIGSIAVPTKRIDRIGNLVQLVDRYLTSPFDQSLEELGLLKRFRSRLEANLVAASGGNPRDVDGFNKTHKYPKDFKAKTKQELVGAYLAGTPLLNLFEGEEIFAIPHELRFEHHHIIAGTGHGKTQTLQYLIGKDLKAVAEGKRSIIVIDSQRDLIRKISRLKYFAPGEPLHDRICIIDPEDIEWPVSLNLFDVGLERINQYPMLEREKLTNSILDLYEYVFGALLAADMTQKQSVIFQYVTRLMLHIPDATILTLRDVLKKGGEDEYSEDIEKLDASAREFFNTEYGDSHYSGTRQEVLRRLTGVLGQPTFERMFSYPQSKLDLYAEMNAGKVILINTSKDLLKGGGTQFFGRFFIAMISQAAQERASIPESERMDTIVYIDEAADYLDKSVETILSQARKYKVGMVLAHQYLGQLDHKLQEAFSANTSIKFAGGFEGQQAQIAGRMLSCPPELIEAQPKGSFATYLRGITPTAIPLKFPFGKLEELPTMSEREWEVLRDKMRERYAVHYKDLGKAPVKDEGVDDHPDAAADDVIYATDESDSFPEAEKEPEPENAKGKAKKKPKSKKPANPESKDDPDNPDTSSSKDW